jgi:hypothetical protein
LSDGLNNGNNPIGLFDSGTDCPAFLKRSGLPGTGVKDTGKIKVPDDDLGEQLIRQ